jgi:GT2 family glycosyltransferase
VKNNSSIPVVVSYFNPKGDVKLYHQTLHCLACWLANGGGEVILSDGSGVKDIRLQEDSARMGFRYVWSNEVLGFGAGYNQGIKAISDLRFTIYDLRLADNRQSSATSGSDGVAIVNRKSEIVCLSANDIFVSPDCLDKMLAVFEGRENVGCVIPYLSQSDLMVQNDWVYKKTREVDCMTLNVNLFKKSLLVDIGFVPEYLSGAFNDIVMAGELKQLNKKIFLCDAGKIYHHAKSTVGVQSLFNFERDKKVFYERHPDLIYLHKRFYKLRSERLWLKAERLILKFRDKVIDKW